ncbi:SDR family oxidoreductase [Fluviicola sp.]|uniref:SDR family oxidoreductase n=1 Tax=Fluviicola sp. TaxID=1917219 RepID=UPI0031DF3309
MEYENNSPFTREEWENCIKVLSVLKDDPFNNPDNRLLATLITKIHKQVKKTKRSENLADRREKDLGVIRNTVVNQQALASTSLFWDSDFREEQPFSKLEIARSCYCCNQPFDLAHFFYARLCPDCAVENYKMRFENTDLTGRKVILTGGRVKVGYATALRFLRNNAEVIVTTRFPALSMTQFQQESDYEAWKDRLTVYGLDLRNLHAIQEFIAYYASRFDTLDILINNAAQTIHYPTDYYGPVISGEAKAKQQLGSIKNLIENQTPISNELKALEYTSFKQESIPLNRFGQPVDMREKNSWNSLLEEISTQELLEVNLINQIAPYLLIKELKPFFLRSTFEEKFIVNVTSSEGLFSYSNKTKYHPHTNMTKAALNMLTRTSAQEFSEDKIYMSCVDVGWISTGAIESLRKKQFEKGAIPPLDSVDGASRIFHPICQGIEKTYFYGVLLKDYKVSEW